MRVKSRKAPKDEPDAAFAVALRLLSRREHSTVELRRKLDQRGFAAALVTPALERLQGEGYLSDQRFALSLARHRADQGYGQLRIRAELAQHGVDGSALEQALAELDADWVERALRQARRHFLEPPETPTDTARMLRYLTQRGFPPGVARRALADWEESVQKQG